MSLPSFVIIANLDCECEFARVHLELEHDAPHGPFTLPLATLETISALGTLMRCVSTGSGDVLWLPARVESSRMVDVPGLPMPRIVPPSWPPPVGSRQVYAWGQTPAVYELDPGRSCPPECAAWVNDREFCLDVARDLGCALPHSRVLRSVEELEAHLETAPATHGDEARWVVKSPFSAAGRSRVIGRGRSVQDTDARRVANLIAAQDRVIFEPWMDRIADFGCSGTVDSRGKFELHGWHAQEVDEQGRFRGTRLVDSPAPFDLEEISRVARGVCDRAAQAGYVGPWSIDFWTYRDQDGSERLHPLGEINARQTFGAITRRLRNALMHEHPWVTARGMRLRIGNRDEVSDRSEQLLLLRPDESGRNAAWVEPAD